MKPFPFAISLLLLFSALLRADARVNVARIPICTAPPMLDGTFAPGEWDKAATLSDFCTVEEMLTKFPSRTYVMYDQENLYVGFTATVDFFVGNQPMEHDNFRLLTTDSFSMNFKHIGTNHCRRFAVEKHGGTLDATEKFGESATDYTPEPVWRVVSHLTPGAFLTDYAWVVEAAIPWTTLELEPRPGLEFGAQMVHYHGDGEAVGERVATWTPYTNPWGIFGFGGDFILAGEDWPVFHFDSYADFAAGQFGLRGTLTQPATVALDFSFVGETMPEQLARAELHGPAVDFARPLPLPQGENCTGQWWMRDAHGLIAGARFRTPVAPRFNVKIDSVEHPQKVFFRSDLRKYGDLPADAQLVCELRDDAGKVVDQKTVPATKDYTEVVLSQADIPAGHEFFAEARLMGTDGSALETARVKLLRLERLEWLDFDGGKFDAPDPATGWRPVEASGDETRRVFQIYENTVAFGLTSPLPERITIRGKDFTAAPMRFVVEDADGAHAFAAERVELLREDGRGFTLRWQGASPEGLAVAADIRIEFDGLVWYQLRLEKPDGKPLTLARVAIELPVNPTALRYVRGGGDPKNSYICALVGQAKTGREVPRPDLPYPWWVSGNGWQETRRCLPFYWLGDDQGGMYYIRPSERNVFVAGDYSAEDDAPERYTFTLNLIDHEVTAEEPLQYDFGFLLTPAKKPVDRKLAWRAHFYGGNIKPLEDGTGLYLDPQAFAHALGERYLFPGQDRNHLKPFPKDYFPMMGMQNQQIMIGNPFPSQKEQEEVRKWSRSWRDTYQAQLLLWLDSLFTTLTMPELAPFCNDWELAPRRRLQVEQFGGVVCATEAWQNCYLAAVQRYQQLGARSFYMDMTGINYCQNRLHGHGWLDQEGKLQPELPFLETREFYLRFQHLIKRLDPNACLYMHGGAGTPLMAWMDFMLWGEEWSQPKDYRSFSSELFQCAYAGAENLGVPLNFLTPMLVWWYPNAVTSGVTMEECCGMAFVHGESVSPSLDGTLGSLRLVWDALDDFGFQEPDAVWTPYYRNPRSPWPDGVLVSTWERGGEILLAIFNWDYQPQDIPETVYAGVTELRDTIGTAQAGFRRLKGRGFLLLRGTLRK